MYWFVTLFVWFSLCVMTVRIARGYLRLLRDEKASIVEATAVANCAAELAAKGTAAGVVMNRKILDTATDPETGWVWVCYGGSDQLGWAWATVTRTGGSFYALEYEKTLGHSSLQRAVNDGITRVAGQVAI